MLKLLSQMKVTVEGKDHFYNCEHDCQLHHVKEALFQFLKFVGSIEDKVKAEQDAIAAQEKVSAVEEEVKPQE